MALVGTEVVVVIAILAVLFWGPKKVPELARALGEARRAFENENNGRDRKSS